MSTHPRQFVDPAEESRGTGPSARLALVPIEHFDGYVVVARLGHGGMAEVFLALSQGPSGFRKLLAIKRLHSHLNNDPPSIEMFLQEAKLAARLEHPNVVQTHKVGVFEGQYFLAMEYLDGQSLSRLLTRLRAQDKSLRPALAARLVSDALDGLHYAHEARDYDGSALEIVHRDVSPHNLFVTYDGQVKLLDFGIARIGALESNTRTGLIKGKFAYIAPEQARGEPIDRRADLWSMAVVLWECLAGERLFRGRSDVDVLRATLHEQIPSLLQVAPHVPVALARIVDRAVQRDRDRRFETALAFKDALEGWLAMQTAARTRSALSATMRSLFADTIAQRKQILCDCLASVDAQAKPRDVFDKPRAARSAQVVLPTPAAARSSDPPVVRVPVRSHLPTRSSACKLAAVLGTVLLAGALALGAESAPKASSPRLSFELDATRAAAQPSTPPASRHSPKPSAVLPNAAPPSGPVEHATEQAPDAAAQERGDIELASAQDSELAHGEADATSAPEEGGERPVALDEPTGRLRLESTPYAVVMLKGRRLGITPIDVELPAATHTLTLRNAEHGIETTYRVTIPDGESISRRLALD